ncbi:FIG051360: Periplasmic protein TonB, links inner and outer membranes [Citrobacter pasteurii]|nr:FIG051360: Periplasmic protein TonB, links inner and outer membranes [Citrobacter pasteurii]
MNDTHYFNLYTSGLGYLNRIREVTPKKGEPFLCCDIAALRGEASNAEHT